MNRVDISVLIVSHGHESMLPECVASLPPALDGLTSEIIVLDNLPHGKVAQCLSQFGDSVRVLENDYPRGLSYNINMLAEQAQGRYLFILNPDTIHHSGLLADAVAFMESRPSAGILGCQLLNLDGTLQVSCRMFPTFLIFLLRGLGVDRWPFKPGFYRKGMMYGETFGESRPVDWLLGATILLRRNEFTKIGGMDEGFRLYYEDVDLCYRYRQALLETWVYPSVSFVHKHMRTSAKVPFGRHWRWHVASACRFFHKHGCWLSSHLEQR